MPQLSKRKLQLKKSREIRKAKYQRNANNETNNETNNKVNNKVNNETNNEANNAFKRLLQAVAKAAVRTSKLKSFWSQASVTVAKATGKNIYRARSIRAWTSNYLQNGTLPVSRQGKHPKTWGFLWDDNVLLQIKSFLRLNKCDRWWNSDDLVNQVVECAIPIFEARFPGAKALFVFDNATSHAAYADNALVANNMNLSPGGKQAKMRSTTYGNNIRQDMCFSMDYKIPELRKEPKGLREILKERKLWHDEMKLKCKGGYEKESINCCARTAIANQPDFKAQRRKLEEAIILAGYE
ncbi:30914_t:CDS:2, partial [Racocetra persica]